MQKVALENYQKLYAPASLSHDFAITSAYYLELEHVVRFLHRHNTLGVGYCLEGAGEFIVENKIFQFQKCSISIINNSEYHTAINKKGEKQMVFY